MMLVGSAQASSIKITGNHLFTDKELWRLADLNKDDDLIVSKIESLYQNQGYFAAKANLIGADDNLEKEIVIDEGKPSYIGNISIDLIPPGSKISFDDLIDEFDARVASESNLNSLAQLCVERMAENGMPFAGAQWRNFRFDSTGNIAAELRIITGPLTYISQVRYKGLKRTRPETLNRALSFRIGDAYCESKIRSSQELFDQMPYLRIAGPFEVEPLGDGDSCRVIYNMRELPSTRFDGAAGVSAIKGKSAFVGRVDLEFGDILGTGRAFGLLWNKKDRLSGELRLTYLEPYAFGSQIDVKLEVHQVDRDSLFIETGAALGLMHQFGSGLGGGLNLAVARTVPETGSNVATSTSRSVGVQFDYDAIDHPDNPTSGYVIMTGLDHKSRTNSSAGANADSLDLPTQLSSAGIDLRYYAKISRRFVTAFGIASWGIISNDGQIPVDELRYIGGFESLRGYTEKQIPAYRYAIATIEPRLITGGDSRAYLFCDLAEIKGGQIGQYHFYPGYGLGLVAPTSLGQFKLEIGWGKTGFPSDAILNFGLAGRF